MMGYSNETYTAYENHPPAQFGERLYDSEEVERIQTAKMTSLRQLVAGITHEMNNPVSVLASNNDIFSRAVDKISSLLTQDEEREPDGNGQLMKLLAALRNISQASKDASDRVAGIVSNLRSFVRLDEAEWQMADIQEGIDGVIAMLELEVTRDYGHAQKSYCSPGALNQVFYSILRNASEATEGGGEISISTTTQNGYIRIEIRDTGRGIPLENRDRIFEPGFTTKNMGIGMGLGLSICHRIIVDDHKGYIDVSSEVGMGTTFTIGLPIMDCSSANHQLNQALN